MTFTNDHGTPHMATAPPPYGTPARPVLVAGNLVKTYGPTFALAGTTLTITAGESVAVMGASGSGKTTLLHVLAGITEPDSGTVILHAPHGPVSVGELGESARSRLRRESFGFVFQEGLLIPELTVVENVALPLMMTGTARTAAEQRALEWLEALGLPGMQDRRIGQLSGGQAQRVAIARAQVTGAQVVFADEPTGALDSSTSSDVMTALLRATVEQGRTLVVVTHDDAVAARCSRVVRLRDGAVVADERSASPTDDAGRWGSGQAALDQSAPVQGMPGHGPAGGLR